MTVEEIIEKQMRAYDDRDIDNMMAVFSEDIKIINFSDSKTIVDGIDECRKMYTELFKHSPNLRAEIIKTISFDNKVIVQEYIHGRNGSSEKMEQVIIFEVNNKKINRITIIRK
ncbi:MAG TPA: nuclear transport factor 2 family protein [Chitinophagaceae bacterium]|nr:nuclear transport factor 2 family protein [Chitinophagaceae bacterium]